MRKFLIFCLLFLVVVPLGLAALMLQDTPLLEASAPPSPQDVAATRQLVRDIRSVSKASSDSGVVLQTDVAQLNSAIRLGARFVDGFRGRVSNSPEALVGEVSVPVPWVSGQKWLNLSGRVPPFDGPFTLSTVTVGQTNIPPGLALFLARTGGNLILGNQFGDRVLGAASAMTLSGEAVAFRLALDDMGKNGLMQSAFGTLRGADMPGPEEIESYHRQIRAAMADGQLSQTGSFLPYIRFALAAAYENSTPETLPNAYTAAIFGLAKVCGAKDFAVIVGRLAFDVAEFSDGWSTSCDAVTFNSRIDSRRHFITSAALQAASNRGFSVSVGEFKELYDTISGAGGFDFTDMAANLSGIRMSNRFMAAPAAEWPELLTLLETENDVIIPFDGIPTLMPDTQFKARFKDVQSPAYKTQIAEIEAKIDNLELHRSR